MFRARIKEEIKKIVGEDLIFGVERPENPEYGDYSSNAALLLAKKEGRNPREVADEIKNKLLGIPSPKWEKIEVAGPGFLNFWIKKDALIKALGNPVSKLEKKKKINIEFVSANPTGPLTMANGRGGFYGDALANVFQEVGHSVTREYYVNDMGHQIRSLGLSIHTVRIGGELKEGHYHGDYITKLAKDKRLAKYKVVDYLGKAAASILLDDIKKSLNKAGIKFDIWFLESKLHKNNELIKVQELLNKKGAIKLKDGAIWFFPVGLGTDGLEGTVVIKSNQEPTYALADFAYHYDKFIKREFDIAIDIWGADHHGHIERMKNGVEAMGIDPSRLEIITIQLVRLIRGGEEVKMSKRTGEFITLDDLLDEVGVDVARWFFLERSLNTHMDFDLDLAKERNKKNPVYYVQYAHARSCSILKKAGDLSSHPPLLRILNTPEELTLIKKILQLTEVIEDIANDYQVHRLTRYAYELAQTFTDFYEKHLVVDPKNKELTQARLALVLLTKKTIKKTLSLMGISAPEKM